MNLEWNYKTIAIVAAIAILFIGTNIGQYFLIWGPKQHALKSSYDKEVTTLKATIKKIGPMVSVWTIKDGVEGLYPGEKIDENDLAMKQIPESMVSRTFVLDPETVVGKYYRVGLTSGTPLSTDLVMDDPMDDTTREYDVVPNTMPIGLKVGDYVDFRIVYPLGEDYIVLSHKRVEAINDKTVKLKLNETEIHYYQAALIDYFLQSKKGSTLYLTKYLEPGTQKAATQYYAVPKNILAIMVADPNIVQKISSQMNEKSRTIIDAGTEGVSQEVGSMISSGRNEIMGKIENGTNQLNNEEKARQDAQAQGKASQPAPSTSSTPAQATNSKNNSAANTSATNIGSTDQSTPPESQSLNIGKGVVE